TQYNNSILDYKIKINKLANYIIIETKQKIICYIGLWIVYEDAKITNVAILEDYRGYKIGEHLFGYAVQYAQNQGAERLSLEVRVSNTITQIMYEKFGLITDGIREKY